jgi:predicted PurR-regulated permease PerM
VDERAARALIRYAVTMMALAVVILWAAWVARKALLLIYISTLLAIGFSSVVAFIERMRLRRSGPALPHWAAILVLYVLIFGAIAFIGMLIVPPLVLQAQGLWREAPVLFERVQQFLIEHGVLHEHLTIVEAVKRAPGSSGDTVGTVLNAIGGIFGGLFGIVTILILTLYMLIESRSLGALVLRAFPVERRDQAAAAIGEVTLKVSAWLNGQLLLGTIIGTTAGVGLWLLGVPYFYVLALTCGVGELIPVVGPVLSAVPAIAVALSVSPQKALVVALFLIAQQQFENHVLVPKIMSSQVGVSAVTVLVALLIGGELLGILGALLAVPTAAILQVIVQELRGQV